MPHLLISAAHKSSGKTTITLGLCAALTEQGLSVQAFKKGPDYIDPMWLSQASGRDCFNLDPYLMTDSQIEGSVARYAAPADISLIEGNKGLYDGLALDGSNSNAALAHLLLSLIHIFTPLAGLFAFVWRMALTTGTGSIFGFLVARQAYDSACLLYTSRCV